MNYPFTLLDNGNLKVTLTVDDLAEHNENEYACIAAMLEQFQLLGNGWSDVTGDIGLTNADAIGYDVEYNDNGEVIDMPLMWYHNSYMIRSWEDDIAEQGYAIFTAHETNDLSYAKNIVESF